MKYDTLSARYVLAKSFTASASAGELEKLPDAREYGAAYRLTTPAEGGSTETPAVSLPTQEQVEQAAGSLYSAASTVLDAILGAGGN